jgi:hypothetical protein
MRSLKLFAFATLATGLIGTTSSAPAQITVNVGAAPVCPYGYYDVAPYNCAPYGYYGPEWFSGGVFIGAGPWFHGPANFQGHVNNHFDPAHGYKGPMPKQNDKAEHDPHSSAHFNGNEARDGRGHVAVGERR